MKLVKEFVEGDSLVTQLLVNNVSKGVNATGSSYLNVELRDASGVIQAKKWEVVEGDENIFVAGNVIEVGLEIIMYRTSLQGKIINAKLVPLDSIDVAKFVKQAPISKDELKKQLLAHVNSIKNEECNKIVNYFIKKFEKQIYDHPAASSIHHEYNSGLLMHTVSMANIAVNVENMYPEINHDLLLSGIILHDIGKIIELEGPVVYKYSIEGKLIGHISIMVSEIRKAADELKISDEIRVLLEHMVLSHHGQLEYGSPVLPQTREALLISLIDNLDSKMTIVDKALEGIEKGEWSQKVYALDSRCFYKHGL